MGLKMGGYICDKCRVIILQPHDITKEFMKLYREHYMLVYCKSCGEVIEKVLEIRNSTLLKDIGGR